MRKIDHNFSHILTVRDDCKISGFLLRLPIKVLCYHISNCSTKHENALNVSNQKLYLLILGLYPEVSGDSRKGYTGDWIHPEYSMTQACFSVLNLQDS